MGAALRAADPSDPVPSCPGWTVADLTAHLTTVHRWAWAALDGASPPPYDEKPATPQDYVDAATAMVSRLRELPQDAPCWTFDRADRTAGFWRRRQLQEVSIHRWDVAQHAIDPVIARDGIDEVVTFFVPRQLGAGWTTVPAGTVVIDDGTRTWPVVTGDGPAVLVRATAPDLNLLLWGRRKLDEVSVDGDATFAAAVFAAALTP